MANLKFDKEITGLLVIAEFDDGKPADEAVHNTCFSCHETVKATLSSTVTHLDTENHSRKE